MDLLWDGGFEATPIGDLIDRMGLSRSSFYAAFGSKRAVLLEALDLYSQHCIRLLRDIAQSPRDARGKLQEVVHQIAHVDEGRGCLMVNVVTERGRHDPDVRKIAANHHSALMGLMTAVLQDAGEPDAILRARVLISGAYGASLMMSSGLSREEVRDLLNKLVDGN
ncbi:TetR/AcrR family transcriptional regulator [Paracoccus liaowanqingii]|nr:TetR/AcrR family transcriptional regulator [Paracoccus liaowanqingii]